MTVKGTGPTAFGDFSAPLLGGGDLYWDRAPGRQNERERGLNFKGSVGKRGKNNDATFDGQLKPLWAGQPYVDSSR